MSAAVVDTNVLVTANRAAAHVSIACMLRAIERLRTIQRTEVVVLDVGWLILGEYQKQASSSGQPGVGDAFLRWVLTMRANPAHCELVPITPRVDDPEDFLEFPQDPALQGFDRADRKFAAVALASRNSPPVVNVADTDWWIFRTALERHGLLMEFLCPELMGQSRGQS